MRKRNEDSQDCFDGHVIIDVDEYYKTHHQSNRGRTQMIKRLLFLLLMMMSSAKADDFYLGVSYSGGKIYPYAKVSISRSTPNDVNKFRWKENHHLYWGSIILGAGIITKSRTLKIIGGLVVFDDACQHILRIQTPFHLINDELGKSKFYRDIVNKL